MLKGVSIKKTGRWSASPVRTEKRYLYMTELLKKIVTLRLEDRVGMAQNIVLESDDPRRISAVWLLYHHRPLMKLLLNRDLVSALLNHSRLQTVPTMSQMNRMQQLTIIIIMLKYFLTKQTICLI